MSHFTYSRANEGADDWSPLNLGRQRQPLSELEWRAWAKDKPMERSMLAHWLAEAECQIARVRKELCAADNLWTKSRAGNTGEFRHLSTEALRAEGRAESHMARLLEALRFVAYLDARGAERLALPARPRTDEPELMIERPSMVTE